MSISRHIIDNTDKVWHDGLIYKLKQNGIKDKVLCFKWPVLIIEKINAGGPQGPILGPILFSASINNLPNGLQSNPKFLLTSLFYFLQWMILQ